MGDLLYEFTEWLRGTSLVDVALSMSDWDLSMWMAVNFWAIPTVQVIHILAIAASFGAILMLNLRLFGKAGTGQSIAQVSARFVPWIWAGLVVLILSGLLMIVGEPVRELINPIFWIKMVLVVGAILFSLWFHNRALKRLSTGQEVGGGLKAGAIFVIALWCVIMLCGRWIAYAPV